MKIITIIGADNVLVSDCLIKEGKDIVAKGDDNISVFDGYHTMDELYEHRVQLFITLCKMLRGYIDVLIKYQGVSENENNPVVWRSKLHDDGTSFDGWFIMGINHGKQITYHLPLSRWEDTEFAETLNRAPKFDGHTSQDVLERLKAL